MEILFQRLLDMAVGNKSVIQKQDRKTLISGVSANKIGRDLTWNWLRGNWPKIYKYYYLSGDLSSAETLVETCASSFNKEFELKELQSFYEEKLLEIGSGKLVTQSARANIGWMNKHYEEIVQWLTTKNEIAKYKELESYLV